MSATWRWAQERVPSASRTLPSQSSTSLGPNAFRTRRGRTLDAVDAFTGVVRLRTASTSSLPMPFKTGPVRHTTPFSSARLTALRTASQSLSMPLIRFVFAMVCILCSRQRARTDSVLLGEIATEDSEHGRRLDGYAPSLAIEIWARRLRRTALATCSRVAPVCEARAASFCISPPVSRTTSRPA